MTTIHIELHPVDDITIDAVGQPGDRVFYIQANQGLQYVTLLVEKIQVQSLAVAIEQFLAEVMMNNPGLLDASPQYDENEMHLKVIPQPLFRVGNFGLGYEVAEDLVILVLQDIYPDENESVEKGVVRLWCTRSQLRRLAHWGVELANRGRPLCPLCGELIPPEGHRCPKNNGHKKSLDLDDGSITHS